MLVLSRKVSQVIEVGDIKITVVAIKGNQVQLGIDAAKDIPIRRPDARKGTAESPGETTLKGD